MITENLDAVTLFVCGDLMTGRGIDQILPHPSDPRLFEPYASSALEYVALVERTAGRIPRPVGFEYVWGDALSELRRVGPDARIVNLETAVTTSPDARPDKDIHYRMHPANLPCLTAAGVDCCVLANNHVLDWGHAGLHDTLDALHTVGIRTAGAGVDQTRAQAPAVIDVPGKARLLVFAFALPTSGVPRSWRAGQRRAGVNWVADLSAACAESIGRQIAPFRRPGDITLASIHWGGNWGYAISPAERDFAHRLIDIAEVDLIHGHSSHHPKGIELYRRRCILYGCGDLLNDYEGIGGYESFRPELSLMYFPTIEPGSGELLALTMTPMQVQRMRLDSAASDAAAWLEATLDRECQSLGTRIARGSNGMLLLQ